MCFYIWITFDDIVRMSELKCVFCHFKGINEHIEFKKQIEINNTLSSTITYRLEETILKIVLTVPCERMK